MTATVHVHRLIVSGSLGVLPGCIIPDIDITILPEITNPGAIRLVQAVPITEQLDAACPGVTCPLPPDTVSFGLILTEDESRAFCSCSGDTRDLNALGEFDVFVEDPDIDPETAEPSDTLLGAFLLDPPDSSVYDATAYLAFEAYLNPNTPAQLVPGAGYNSWDDLRPTPNLKAWRLGAETGVDLCNPSPGVHLTAELHSLQLVVTDRPWYVPFPVDERGLPERNEDGSYRVDPNALPLAGVPNLPGGATYDIANYVFRCEDAAMSPELCNCSVEAES